jgi:hypothetical protein
MPWCNSSGANRPGGIPIEYSRIDGQHAVTDAQFARHDVENLRLAAMGIEQDQPPHTCRATLSPDRAAVRSALRWTATAFRKGKVFVAFAYRLQRQGDDVEIGRAVASARSSNS